MATETQIAFQGTKQEQELARSAFEAIKRKHVMHGVNAPIKMTAAAIAEALTKAGGPMAGTKASTVTPKLEAAMRANTDVFAEGDNGEFYTTKSGRAPSVTRSENTHTFKERLNTDATQLDADAARQYHSTLVSKSASRAERSALLESVPEPPPVSPIRPAYNPIVNTPYARSTEQPTLIPRAQVAQERQLEEEEAAAAAPAVPATPAPVTPAAAAPGTAQPAAATPAAQPVVAAPPAPVQAEAPAATAGAPVTPAAPTAAPAQSARQAAVEAPARPTTPVQPAPQVEAPTPPAEQQAPAAAADTAPATAQTAPAPAQAATPAPVAQPAPAKPAPPPVPVVTGPVEVNVPTADGPITVDLTQSIDDILAGEAVYAALTSMIGPAVESDTRLITFGSDIFPDEATERFSKGDYRRIKEYLEEPETGGVASDRDIMADVFGRRVDHPDYERVRFSLNYRMLKEKKDFEFVGIDSDRLWIPAGSTPAITPLRKPAEVGQDYRFLEDPATAEAEQEYEGAAQPGGAPVEYSLTYYEYENGVLPYDLRFKRVVPGAVFADQRAALIRFEIPQLYGSLIAELRYPTGNRGGFIMGLNELFEGHMVPGTRFTLVPTDRGEDVFEIHFAKAEEVEDNLLQYDERKGRYVFRPVLYSVVTDPSMLLTQEKFGKLHNQKRLDDSERRKPDIIIANAFEAIGEENDGKLWAIFDDLFPVVNLDRPMSRSWLRTLLSGAYPFFYADESTEGAYFYDASKRTS
jgi:hypothetical protein